MFNEPHRQLERDLPRLDMYSQAFRTKLRRKAEKQAAVEAAAKAKAEREAAARAAPTAKDIEDKLVDEIVSKGHAMADHQLGARILKLDEAKVLRVANRRAIIIAARKRARQILREANAEAKAIRAAARAEAQAARDALMEAEKLGFSGERRPAKEILREVANAHGFLADDIIGVSRYRPVVEARQAAMAAVYQERADLSLPQIGIIFKRDHTTIHHALTKMGVLGNRPGRSPYSPVEVSA
jgi:hypothetical protein